MDDIDEILEAAKHMAFQEPRRPFILNSLSTLATPKRHIKTALKERIRGLVGAYVSLATLVEDEEVLGILGDPKGSRRVYQEVLGDMEKNSREIKEFLKSLAVDTDALDT